MEHEDKQHFLQQNSADYSLLLHDVQQIVEQARQHAYAAVNVALVRRNWQLGRRIREEELRGEARAEYGARVIKRLSHDLTALYGQGFDYSSLYKYARFYEYFPEILDSLSTKSQGLLT